MSAPPDVYATARPGLVTRLASRAAARARRRRHELFERALAVRPGDRILDVGCGAAGLRALDPDGHEIVGLDVLPQPSYPGRLVVGDARAMPFGDGEFDVAWCNSLIEHVAPADRPRVAAEVRRVAGRWLVQTPNRWFPIEPHVLLPGFQFLPRALQRRLRRFGASGEDEEVRLLGARELRRLFPDAVVVRERVGPLTKSLMALGPRERVRLDRASRRPPSGA
ncbi:MAG TPA: class I SAM-dependent methyltransferase [Thermoleophilaceae bacterium]